MDSNDLCQQLYEHTRIALMEPATIDVIGQMSATLFKKKHGWTTTTTTNQVDVIRAMINFPVVSALDAFIRYDRNTSTSTAPTRFHFKESMKRMFSVTSSAIREVVQHFRISRMFLMRWWHFACHRLRRQFENYPPQTRRAFSHAWWTHICGYLVKLGASGLSETSTYDIASSASLLSQRGCNMSHLLLLEHPIHVRLATAMLLQQLKLQLTIMRVSPSNVSYLTWCEQFYKPYHVQSVHHAITLSMGALYNVFAHSLSDFVSTGAPSYLANRYPRWHKQALRTPRLRLRRNQVRWSTCQVTNLMVALNVCLDEATAIIVQNEELQIDLDSVDDDDDVDNVTNMNLGDINDWPYMTQRLGEVMCKLVLRI